MIRLAGTWTIAHEAQEADGTGGAAFGAVFVGDTFFVAADTTSSMIAGPYRVTADADDDNVILFEPQLGETTITDGVIYLVPDGTDRLTNVGHSAQIADFNQRYREILDTAGSNKQITLNKTASGDNAGIVFKAANVSVGRVGAFADNLTALQQDINSGSMTSLIKAVITGSSPSQTLGLELAPVVKQSATAFTVGRLAATPALKVNTNTGSSITGLEIVAAAASGGLAIKAIGETNIGVTFDAAGTGSITFNGTATGDIIIPRRILNTVAASVGLAIRSGASGSFAAMSIGRTTDEAYVGVSGGAGNITAGSAAGDLCIIGGPIQISPNGGSNTYMSLSAAGKLTLTGAIAGSTSTGTIDVTGGARVTGSQFIGGNLTLYGGGGTSIAAGFGASGLYVNPNDDFAHITVETAGGVEGGFLVIDSGTLFKFGSFSNHNLVIQTNSADVATVYTTGGMTLGSATGGDQGAGKFNAVGVYDDSVLLTCFGVEYLLDGKVDVQKWDSYSPVKRNPLVHDFCNLLKQFDPRDPAQYIAQMRRTRALPGMPTEADWQHNTLSVGSMHNHLWLSTELLAAAFIGHMEDTERRLAAMERKRAA